MLIIPTSQHGLAINLVDGPKSMAVLKEIERHFGKDIAKLDAEDVDEIEKLNQEWYYVPPVRIFRFYIPVQVVARQKIVLSEKLFSYSPE